MKNITIPETLAAVKKNKKMKLREQRNNTNTAGDNHNNTINTGRN